MRVINKLIIFLMVFAIVMTPFSMSVYADSMDGAVEINKANFPDPLFRNFMLNGSHMIWDEDNNQIEVVYDANKDGWLSVEEAENIKQLLAAETYIKDLKGMEYLTELIEVDCQRSSVEKLYLSDCGELRILNCYKAQLKGALDLSKNAKLEGAACHNNRELTGIDTSGCKELYNLTCGATGVASLDLRNNPKLRFVSCEDTPITELDFTNNPELITVSAYNSDLAHIDVSNNTKLEMLDVSNCKLTSLDLRNNQSLMNLIVYGNNFAWFELGDKPELDVTLDESIIDLEMTEPSFDITEIFPGIDPAKVAVVSGASLEGSVVKGYTSEIPVVYTYDCGMSANGKFVLNVTLNINGYTAPAVPDDENTSAPEDDKKTAVDDDSDNQDKAPDTGDDFSFMIWLTMMILAVSIMVKVFSIRLYKCRRMR